MIPIRISICIPITISSLIFHGTGCTTHKRQAYITQVFGIQRISVSHVTHIWMSHVTHIWMSHVTHIWMSHVTHIPHTKGKHTSRRCLASSVSARGPSCALMPLSPAGAIAQVTESWHTHTHTHCVYPLSLYIYMYIHLYMSTWYMYVHMYVCVYERERKSARERVCLYI